MDLNAIINDSGIEKILQNSLLKKILYGQVTIPLEFDEKILWIGHRSIRSFLLHFIMAVGLFIISCLLFVGQLWFLSFYLILFILFILITIIIDSRSDTYTITNKHVILINTEKFSTIPLSSINSVQIKNNLFTQILHVGTLIIDKTDQTRFLSKDLQLACILSVIAPWAGLFYAKRYNLSVFFFIVWFFSCFLSFTSLIVILLTPITLVQMFGFLAICFVHIVFTLIGAITAFTSAITHNIRNIGGMFAIDDAEKIKNNLTSMIGRI